MRSQYWPPFRAALLLLSTNLPGLALDIKITDIGAAPMNVNALIAFDQAAGMWEARFTDLITVNINVALEPLGSDILGETHERKTTHSYDAMRTAMFLYADDLKEELAILTQPSTALFGPTPLPIQDVNGLRNVDKLTLNSANAKALGLGTGHDFNYGEAPVGGADATLSLLLLADRGGVLDPSMQNTFTIAPDIGENRLIVHDVLSRVGGVFWPGDANTDGIFSTADLIQVFDAGEYEDDIKANSGWGEGDWNGDREFLSDDLIAALAIGRYDPLASVPEAKQVPEPGPWASLLLAVMLLCRGFLDSWHPSCPINRCDGEQH